MMIMIRLYIRIIAYSISTVLKFKIYLEYEVNNKYLYVARIECLERKYIKT